MLILNVIYVLLALAMIVFILMQRGAGASAGSGFGRGASGTVFGSRGSANFLSKSTKWLAILFMGISLFMAWHVKHNTGGPAQSPAAAGADLGVMGNVPQAPATNTAAPVPTAPATDATLPANGATPAAPAPTQTPESPVKK